MATFVQLEPDAFQTTFANVLGDQGNTDSDVGKALREERYHHVRRPVRGIQIKDDTYATLQVRNAQGQVIPLFDSGANVPVGTMGKSYNNSNFIIQSISEQRAEKQQIIMTFGAPYIFFFGEQPRLISVSGVLLNSEDFNWRAEWWENYNLYLRGTQCVRKKARVYLAWDDIVVEGYIIAAGADETAENRNIVSFQFQMFLTNYHNISSIGDPNAHFQGKSINLTPVDVVGSPSKTINVRQENIRVDQLEAGNNKNSLFDFLRDGKISDASSRIVELQGQVVDILSVAGRFVSGRNIRVPVGFTGAAAYDQEVQLAIASIPGASEAINGQGPTRVISLKAGGLNMVAQFRAILGSKYGPALVGKPLSANTDEFIARIQLDDFSLLKSSPLTEDQTTSEEGAMQKVRDMYAKFNIDTEPSSELSLLFRKSMFGIVAVASGLVVNDSTTLRSAFMVTGAVL